LIFTAAKLESGPAAFFIQFRELFTEFREFGCLLPFARKAPPPKGAGKKKVAE
jgi:hypothetical protein